MSAFLLALLILGVVAACSAAVAIAIIIGYARGLRKHGQMMSETNRRTGLLETVHSVAATLLTIASTTKFDDVILEALGIVGRLAEADRVHIWQNEAIGGKLHMVHKYEWLDGSRQSNVHTPIGLSLPYSEVPELEPIFLNGEYINSPMSALPPKMQSILNRYEIKAIVIIPIFLHDQFWGFFSLDDCSKGSQFPDDVIAMLRSTGLMFGSAINRESQAVQIGEVLERTSMILNGMPLGCDLWDEDHNLFDCNDEAIRLFNRKDKQDYLSHVLERYPEYQPDGMLSKEKLKIMIGDALRGEKRTLEWEHLTSDGSALPTETTYVRFKFGEKYVVAAYKKDLREQKRIMAELEKALANAEEANNAKTNFLANMSHEMRTPLNAVLGLSELALEMEGLPGEADANLEKIYSAGSTLLSTVNDILDISKIEAGKFEIVCEDYDIPSLINDSISQNILRIGERPIKFVLDIDGGLPIRLNGDELRVKQVMNNILSNAFKYTREGTVELSVRCERDGGLVWMTIRVSDTGLGIQPRNIDKLFSDYAQFDTKSNYGVEGTGLGLPITKRILDMMGGSIGIESEYGKGSVFTVKLPQGFVTDEAIGSGTVENLKKFYYSNDKRAHTFKIARVKLPYARVLIVDDIDTNLDVAKGLMKPYGMKIDCATSGQQAIDAVRAGEPAYSAIFMDHMMPGMDGIEATRIIREEIGTDYAKNVPIIALTANAIVGNEKMFLNMGFQAFLSKPIEISRLDEVLRHWVRDKSKHGWVPIGQGEGTPEDSKGGQEWEGADKIGGHDRREMGKMIPGIDALKGAERFGGLGAYLEILRSYAKNTRPLLETIRGVGRGSLEIFATRVHGLKGASYGICAFGIGAMAENLENAAKAGDYGFVEKNNGEFIETAEKLISNINKTLAEIDDQAPKPRKEMPDKEVLAKLLDACHNYDMDGAEEAMAVIDSYEYGSDNGFVAWLRENVSMANFVQVGDKLSFLLDRAETNDGH